MTDSQATLTLTINDCPVEVPVGTTVLQACQQLGVEVPVFCYHPKLEVAGNCRMCLVQIGTHPKPAASCALPAAQGMTVYTNTSLVHDARKGVLEFLLINHPLDCPICD
jgi:NADH-quinone oxidoreductase subunit G